MSEHKKLKFVPPKEEAKKLPKYASYVVGSGMKLHGRLGDAKNSFSKRGWTWEDTGKTEEVYGCTRPVRRRVTLHSFILENVDGEWFVLYEIPAGTKADELPWMKEYYADYQHGYYSGLYTDSMKNSSYCQKKLADGTAKIEKRPYPMTTDEYVAWRIAVELERRGIS